MQISEAEIEKTISEKIFALTLKRITSSQEELIESGILSSITMAELAVELEKELRVSFSFMDVSRENFKTIDSIRKLVLQKMSHVL